MFELKLFLNKLVEIFYFIIPETPYNTRLLFLFGIFAALFLYIVPVRKKSKFILVISVLFILIATSPLHVAIFLAFTIIFYICSHRSFNFKNYIFYFFVGLLLVSNFILVKITGQFSVYFSFAMYFSLYRIIHYYIDSKQDSSLKKSYWEYISFLLFFPTFCHGPIERVQNFKRHKVRKEDIKFAAKRFFYAAIKFMIFAHILLKIEPVKFSFTNLGLWLLLTAYVGAFKLFFLLSSDWDIVLALSRLMGYRLIENFPKTPYLQSNLTRFWRNWHWSLVNWLTGYIYIPLGRNRKYLNLKIVFVLLIIGWGHLFFNSADIPSISLIAFYTLWGVWLGGALALSKVISQKMESEKVKNYFKIKSIHLFNFIYGDNKLYKALRTFLTFTIIAVGWQSPLYLILINL